MPAESPDTKSPESASAASPAEVRETLAKIAVEDASAPQNLEDRLIRDDLEDVLDNKHLDEPIVAPDKIGSSSPKPAVRQPDATSSPSARQSPPEKLPEIERVVGENVAAAATSETADLVPTTLLDDLLKASDEETPPPLAPEPRAQPQVSNVSEVSDQPQAAAAPPELESAPPPKPTVRSLSRVVILWSLVRQDPYRVVLSLAVGIISTVGVFVFLYANQLRPVRDVAELTAEQSFDLRRAMDQARALMDSGKSDQALLLLEKVLTTAPMTAEIADARFLQIEAWFRALPPRVNDAQAAPLHEAIDRLIEFAPAHPDAPEALLRKAQLYERQGDALAARGVLRNLLTDYPNAENLDHILLTLGKIELDHSEFEAARNLFQQLLSDYPSTPLVHQARLLLGDALAGLGDLATAQGLYLQVGRAQTATDLGAEAFERLGKLAYDAGAFNAAIRELEQRLATATTVSGNDRIYLLLARVYRATGRLNDARNTLNELLDFFPESEVTPDAYVELTQVLNMLGMGREAARLAAQTVNRFPEHPGALKNQAEFLVQAGDPLQAGETLLAAVDAGDNDPNTLLRAGRLLLQGGETTRARRTFDRVATEFRGTPQALEAVVEQARAMYRDGRVTAAIARLENLAETVREPQARAVVLDALGSLYLDMGLTGPAAETYRRMATLASSPEQLAAAARALFQAEQWSDGAAVASRINIKSLSPTVGYDFLIEQGRALLRVDPPRGLERLEEAYETFPEQRTAKGNELLLDANLRLGRTARARAIVLDLQNSVQANRADPAVLTRLANLLGDYAFTRGDYQAAADAYALAVGAGEGVLSPGQQWAVYQRANALYHVGNRDEARALYQSLVQMNSTWAREAQAKAAALEIEQRLRG